jgi:hypothetical protein
MPERGIGGTENALSRTHRMISGVTRTEALTGLGRMLEARGLAAFLAAFPPHSTRRDRWRRELGSLDGELRSLVELFVLGERVAVSDLPVSAVDGLEPLVAAGLAECAADARLCDVVLARPLGAWLLSGPDPINARHYFNTDSIALAMHATYREGETCLDLCAGAGFQAIIALARCRSAVLVELQPETAEVAAVNIALNGLQARAEVRSGDLFGAVAGDRFGHVVANVPFVPSPDGLPFPAAAAGGGEDGFGVARRVLAGLWDHLEPDGSAHLAGMLLRDSSGLLLADEIDTWARANDCAVHVVLTAAMPVGRESPLVRATAGAVAAAGGELPEDDIVTAVTDMYARQGALSASWAFARIDRSGVGLRLLDLARANQLGPWISVS